MGKFNQTIRTCSPVFENGELIYGRFDYSTADIEDSLFFGDSSFEIIPQTSTPGDINGIVRLIDGKLFEVANLVPPNTTPIQKTSGLFRLAGC